jgi:hypothetical protein
MSQRFTFYCEDHREQVKLGPSPNDAAPGHAIAPCCPVCYRMMFWVPNGGTVVPPAPASSQGSP